MATVGSYEAKTHLPKLLERVRRGERITITRHGEPVAELVPAGSEPKRKRSVAEAIESIERRRKGMRLDGLSIRDLIDEGRKY